MTKQTTRQAVKDNRDHFLPDTDQGLGDITPEHHRNSQEDIIDSMALDSDVLQFAKDTTTLVPNSKLPDTAKRTDTDVEGLARALVAVWAREGDSTAIPLDKLNAAWYVQVVITTSNPTQQVSLKRGQIIDFLVQGSANTQQYGVVKRDTTATFRANSDLATIADVVAIDNAVWARAINQDPIPGSKLTNAPRDTAAQIRDKLQTLTADDRLDASAIQNLPSGGGSGDDAFDWATEGNTDLVPDAKLPTSPIWLLVCKGQEV